MAGPPPFASAAPDLGDSYGVMLISTIIVSVLYGVTSLQTLYYYDRFPRDPWLLKAAVAVVWVLDTVTIVLDTHAVYYYLIANYNNPVALSNQVWSAQVEVLVTYTVVMMVQTFFVIRIYQLRPYAWYIPLPMAVLALVSYTMVIAIEVAVFKKSDWGNLQTSQVNDPLVANWVLGMIVDIAITAVLCWYLSSEKVYVRRKTHRMINRIIVFSVNRGAIAAVVQVMTLLTKFIYSPENLVWLAFHNALSKVYANSMLATLNSRTALRDMMESDGGGTELTLPTIRRSAPGGNPGGQADVQVATLEFARAQTSTLEWDSAGSADSERYRYGMKEANDSPPPGAKLGVIQDKRGDVFVEV